MGDKLRRRARGWLGAVCIGGLAALAFTLTTPVRAAEAVERPGVEAFFKAPALSAPVLSPDGRSLAAAVPGPDGRMKLAVLDLNRLDASRVVASFTDADVQNYHWVNDQRLVFSITDRQAADRPLAPGLWAVNRDGADMRQLIHAGSTLISGASLIADKRLNWEWRLYSVLQDGSDDIVVIGPVLDGRRDIVDSRLLRINTRTGQRTSLVNGAPEHVLSWLVNAKGEPLFAASIHQGRWRSYLRDGTAWKSWEDSDYFKGSRKEPLWISDRGQMLIKAQDADGFATLQMLDVAQADAPPRTLLSLKGYDLSGRLVIDRDEQRLVGVHFETDGPSSVWFDADLRALQAEVDQLLPGTVNRIDCARCIKGKTVLLTASSDRQPPVYFLFHRDSKKLELIAQSRPWIDARHMAERDMVRIQARDGLEVPVLLTKPAGPTQPRPTVVLVHGGPWVRGAHWTWEPMAQFLASRGYLVIEPEFRGSTGYGSKHFVAGWKQWGLAMQDDVADALQWAVGKGLADPKRTCIAGASYGGYATLMGLIKHPELYRCGVNWVGVSDISLMYSISWSDASADWTRYGMPALVGDREKDAEQLKQTSPLARAAELKRPLLMAYGGQDYRVPLPHGTAFKNALPKGTDLEWVVYPQEGHGWFELSTHIDFWTRVEKFLDKHIGSVP